MENNQNYNELEVLHSQMEDFKAQLNQQKIVNEKLIIRSMKKSMLWIKKYIYFEFCLIPVIAIMWLGIKEFAHLSWFNYLFVMTIVVVDVIADYRINVSALGDEDYSRNNLLTTISKLTRMKRQRSIQMILFLPAFVVWLSVPLSRIFSPDPAVIAACRCSRLCEGCHLWRLGWRCDWRRCGPCCSFSHLLQDATHQ